MTTDLPAMRRFKRSLHEIAVYGGLLATKGQPTKLAPALVSDVENEGAAIVGAVPCPLPHGVEVSGEIDRGRLPVGRCPACGAAL